MNRGMTWAAETHQVLQVLIEQPLVSQVVNILDSPTAGLAVSISADHALA